jgi:hypothetical protein
MIVSLLPPFFENNFIIFTIIKNIFYEKSIIQVCHQEERMRKEELPYAL